MGMDSSSEKGLLAAVRGPSWAVPLTAVLVAVGALDALLSYQAFALFLDADLLGTGARTEAERQAGLVNGLSALAATGILTMLCIALPQVAAKFVRKDQGSALAKLPRAGRLALAGLFLAAALVLAAGIGAVRYQGQLATSDTSTSSSFAAAALEQAGLAGGASGSAGTGTDAGSATSTALMWAVFTAFLLFLAEMLGFALACVRGAEPARRYASLMRMEKRAADLERRAADLREQADKAEDQALRRVDACENAFNAEVDKRLGEILMRHVPHTARGMADWL